ncbi:hypothetical protein LOK49_LG09G01736 [Camellia lanceoleosa]|uniref:Uncharacterized protein n=1 Tax=Camellia lanceoleosa TaxID=1840588 RepID=A0ACC0GGR7_9ERIC|nr:hypothetical protein LOK49_LG09G01736 [Camellia lanceoleosa]
MARFLLICIVLAQLSVFMEGLNLVVPMAMNGPDRMPVLGLKNARVPSPAPSSGGGSLGTSDVRNVTVPSPAPSSGGESLGTGDVSGNRRVMGHHSSDKSEAGGEVIIGGFATALVAAIFCYIRVTRRN